MDNLPQNNKKTFLSSLAAKIILALIIFAGSVIIIISGTKFIVEYYKMPNNNKIIKQVKQTEQEKNQVDISDLPSEASATEDWQTYRNEKLGFEFKYPEGSGWELIDGIYLSSKEIILLNNKFNRGKFRMEINLIVTKGAILEENIEYWEDKGLIFIENFQLDDLVGKKLWVSDIHTDSLIYLFNRNEKDTLFIFSITGIDTENDEYLIWLFDQILSTFTFIEKDETADWQTYQNEEFGIEFKYPKIGAYDDEIKLFEKENVIKLCTKDDMGREYNFCHSLEVFKKLEEETVKDAIKRIRIKDEDQSVCFVKEDQLYDDWNFKIYKIVDQLGRGGPAGGSCSYYAFELFAADPKNPQIFFLLPVIQDSFLNVEKWFKSFKFIDQK